MTFLFLAKILFTISSVFAVETVVIYSDDAYMPYSYANQEQKPTGIYVEIIKKITAKMPEYKVLIKPTPWSRAIKELENGNVFAVFPPYYKPVERPFIKTYSNPILEEDIVVYTRKELLEKNRKAWPEDWYGSHVALFLGTMDIAGAKFKKAFEEKKFKITEEKGNEKNLILLAQRKRDVYINDRNAIKYTINQLKHQKSWPVNSSDLVEATVVSKEFGHLAYSPDDTKFPYKNDFVKKFNTVLDSMKKNGDIEKIVEKYLE